MNDDDDGLDVEVENQVFKNGTKVKVVGNRAGHNIPIGTILTIRGNTGNGLFQVIENHLNYYSDDLKALAIKLEELEIDMKEAELQYEDCVKKVNYMKKSGAKKYDADEYRKFSVKEILESDLSIKDKTDRIEFLYK